MTCACVWKLSNRSTSLCNAIDFLTKFYVPIIAVQSYKEHLNLPERLDHEALDLLAHAHWCHFHKVSIASGISHVPILAVWWHCIACILPRPCHVLQLFCLQLQCKQLQHQLCIQLLLPVLPLCCCRLVRVGSNTSSKRSRYSGYSDRSNQIVNILPLTFAMCCKAFAVCCRSSSGDFQIICKSASSPASNPLTNDQHYNITVREFPRSDWQIRGRRDGRFRGARDKFVIVWESAR